MTHGYGNEQHMAMIAKCHIIFKEFFFEKLGPNLLKN
jgi:hypothetical protein